MENQLVVQHPNPLISKDILRRDFENLGLQKGDRLIVHSSLRSIGWVLDGETTVIQTLMETITKSGTIVMPAQTTHNIDPKYWEEPVPEEWWPTIRLIMPAYLPDFTPTVGMGKIAETFRTFPYVTRSAHPTCSFTAWGQYAKEIIQQHALDFPFGNHSPLAKLYDLDATILFIGTSYETCTAMHLGEFRANDGRRKFKQGSALLENGERSWKTYWELEARCEQFPAIGAAFEQVYSVQEGKLGQAEAKLIPLRSLVDFTVHYLQSI